jgi:hypothetical protein
VKFVGIAVRKPKKIGAKVFFTASAHGHLWPLPSPIRQIDNL